ncbi:hypothetical protein OD795_37865, partial [Pseudomonas aeruginosa]
PSPPPARLASPPAWRARRRGADGAALAAFAQRHLAMHCWPASAQAITLAEQMLRPPALAPARGGPPPGGGGGGRGGGGGGRRGG